MFLHTKLETRADPIKIAFIGCGKFVSMFLAQYNHLDKIQIDSIVDININQAKKNVAKNVGLVVGTEAGIYGGVGDYAYQAANVNLGRQEDINIGQTLLMTGLTATGGGLLGWGIPTLTRTINKNKLLTEEKPFDEIFNAREEARIAKIQSKVKEPVSGATKVATKVAREVFKRKQFRDKQKRYR